jgi:5'-deoxynucleotidase YfbR-like HD superfamily hydrolase
MRERWIPTFSGRRVWPVTPQTAQIVIEDVAHALAMKCRWTGHTREFYSVAQHSVLVSENVPPAAAMWGLLHDASEAYLPDIARPYKDLLTFRLPDKMFSLIEFEIVELQILKRVAECLGLARMTDDQAADIKFADRRLLATERRDLIAESDFDFGLANVPTLPRKIVPWTWQEAKANFLRRFAELKG